MEKFDVVIAGGGLSGLSLALALRASSAMELKIAILDRHDPRHRATSAPDGRASALSMASRNLLDLLGLWRHLKSHAQPITEIDITDGHLDSPLRQVFVHYDNCLDDGSAASFVIENQYLLDALRQAASVDTGITFITAQTILQIEALDAVAEISTSAGTTWAGKLVVAADGRRSTLRRLAGIKTIGWQYDQMGIVTTVSHEKPHEGRAVQHFLPAGPFAILPLPGGNRSSLVWTEEFQEAIRIVDLDDAAFLAELVLRFGRRLGRIELRGHRATWPLDFTIARRLVAERCVLIGDAAHGVHPIAGQGFNIALRDVAALTEVLVDARRLGLDIGSGAHLERYQRWRRFDALQSGLTFDCLNRLFSNDNPILRTARDFGLGMVDRLPGLKRALVLEAAGLTGEVPKLLRGEEI